MLLLLRVLQHKEGSFQEPCRISSLVLKKWHGFWLEFVDLKFGRHGISPWYWIMLHSSVTNQPTRMHPPVRPFSFAPERTARRLLQQFPECWGIYRTKSPPTPPTLEVGGGGLGVG